MAGYSVSTRSGLNSVCINSTKIQSSVCVNVWIYQWGYVNLWLVFLLAYSGRTSLGACLCSYPGMFPFLKTLGLGEQHTCMAKSYPIWKQSMASLCAQTGSTERRALAVWYHKRSQCQQGIFTVNIKEQIFKETRKSWATRDQTPLGSSE